MPSLVGTFGGEIAMRINDNDSYMLNKIIFPVVICAEYIGW